MFPSLFIEIRKLFEDDEPNRVYSELRFMGMHFTSTLYPSGTSQIILGFETAYRAGILSLRSVRPASHVMVLAGKPRVYTFDRDVEVM